MCGIEREKQKLDPDHGKAYGQNRQRGVHANKGVQSGDRVWISDGDRSKENCRQWCRYRDRARNRTKVRAKARIRRLLAVLVVLWDQAPACCAGGAVGSGVCFAR